MHAINQTIRQARKSSGDLTEETLIQTDHGKRAFAKGDRMVFTQNDRLLGVRNGMLGTVKVISKTEIKIHLDGRPSKTITINPNYFTAFDHGYATTIHKSQGVTVDRTYVLASRTIDRHLAYVAMTRHRMDAEIYISKSDIQQFHKLHTQSFINSEQSPVTQRQKKGPIR